MSISFSDPEHPIERALEQAKASLLILANALRADGYAGLAEATRACKERVEEIEAAVKRDTDALP